MLSYRGLIFLELGQQERLRRYEKIRALPVFRRHGGSFVPLGRYFTAGS